MAVLYKLVQDKREKSANKGKWYCRAIHIGVCDTNKLAEIIQRNCSIKKSDVKAVLEELFEVMRDQLQDSKRVVLDGVGSFKIGLKSVPADTPEEFSVTKNINGARVNFLPAIELSESHKRVKRLLSGLRVNETPFNDVARETEDGDEPNP